ncbi:MAG TPA: M56 family metallopeptidase, partial [Longimicrobiaceae bacterium]|nr:M56 family metallopeptidase [Longimicrobiaceae bacterium]
PDDLGVFSGGSEPGRRPLDAGLVLAAAWLCGVLVVGARAAASRVAARRLVQRARPAPGWETAATRIPVLESAEVAAPALAGIRRPVVLLPPGSAAWPEEMGRAVLQHELAHAERRDLLVDLLAQAACALHWYNPLAWYAARRLTVERERACDDRVLARGGDALAYASVLLAVARAALAAPPAPRGLLAMARPTELELRFTAILDPARRRGRLTAASRTVLAAGAALLLLPLAAFRPGVAADPAGTPATGRTPLAAADTLLDPRSELVPLAYDALAEAAAAVPVSGPDADAIARLRAELTRVPRGYGDLVRERAIWTLLQVRDGRLVEPLLESLGDRDWKVRAYAAWGLAVAGDHRALPRLLPLLEDPVWRVRAMAAAALADHADPAAFDAMAAALRDPAWQVRISAVHYLEQVGDPRAPALLRPLLRDPHAGTRTTARGALARLAGR